MPKIVNKGITRRAGQVNYKDPVDSTMNFNMKVASPDDVEVSKKISAEVTKKSCIKPEKIKVDEVSTLTIDDTPEDKESGGAAEPEQHKDIKNRHQTPGKVRFSDTVDVEGDKVVAQDGKSVLSANDRVVAAMYEEPAPAHCIGAAEHEPTPAQEPAPTQEPAAPKPVRKSAATAAPVRKAAPELRSSAPARQRVQSSYLNDLQTSGAESGGYGLNSAAYKKICAARPKAKPAPTPAPAHCIGAAKHEPLVDLDSQDFVQKYGFSGKRDAEKVNNFFDEYYKNNADSIQPNGQPKQNDNGGSIFAQIARLDLFRK